MRHRLANCDKTTDGAFETMWIGMESYDFQRVAELTIPGKRDRITELLQDVFGLFGSTVQTHSQLGFTRSANIVLLDPLDLGESGHMTKLTKVYKKVWTDKMGLGPSESPYLMLLLLS